MGFSSLNAGSWRVKYTFLTIKFHTFIKGFSFQSLSHDQRIKAMILWGKGKTEEEDHAGET
jgi:hypothetical protein